MVQMHRMLLSASSYSLFGASSSSVLRLHPFTVKCRALRSRSASDFPFSPPLATYCKYRQCSQLKLRQPGMSFTISINYPKLTQSLANRSIRALAEHSSTRPASLACATPGYTVSYCSRNDSIILNSCDYGDFPRRHFSQVSQVTNKKTNMGGFSMHWKQAKPLAVNGKNKATDSSISASNDVDDVHSTEHMVGEVKLGSSVSTSPVSINPQNAKVAGRQKSQSRKKRNNEKPSITIATEEAAAKRSSKSTSRANRSVAGKTGQNLPPALERPSTENTHQEVPDTLASKEHQSKKRSVNPTRKGKSAKTVKESAKKPKHQGTLKQLYPPTGKSVVVVESVTKAKVIQGYLGDMYEVLPSYGHVRDLAARSGSVRPDDDFSMVWEVPSPAWTHLKSIKVALSGAENLILASDPDREGEAIAWHIVEMLQQQDAFREDVIVARVVFHEITEASIKNALQAPREIDINLVRAYLARRALDYLIGFNISPILWRKLPGCQSAGRVQSAALSLICDREMEIDEFKAREYWSVEVDFKKKELSSLANAHLTHFDSKKLNQFSITSHTEGKDIEQKINSENLLVIGSKTSKIRKNPPPPYITSTLQQDAANNLYFSTTYTMKLAQKLYEGVRLSDGTAMGLMTYPRTDGLHISDEAAGDIHSLVTERYGPDFASGVAGKYFKKVKNAQEAHEAIRPTNVRMLPSMLTEVLDEDSLKLYTLIWSRTVARQMEPATINQVQVDIGNAGKSIILRSACSMVDFLGYQAVYEDVNAGAKRNKENKAYDHSEVFGFLNSLKPGDPIDLSEVKLQQHFTQPPPRFSEGSLIKKLEELGIGRPSTYASTLKVLKERNYVTLKNRVLYPEFRGRMVSAFLSHHFTEVTDYSFTADMETQLDNVSAGLTEWKNLLRDYWTRFRSYCKRTESVHIHQVEKMLEEKFRDFLFSSFSDNSRTCPSCMEGTLIFKVSRFGAGYFIGCDQHPDCKYIAKRLYGCDEEEEETVQNNSTVDEPKLLGLHPVSNEKILLKSGPYGFYIQLGEDRKGSAPKRTSVSHIKDVNTITIEGALELLRYPVTLGMHPKDGHPVVLKISNTGFSIKHRRSSILVPKKMKPDDVTLEKALKLLLGKDVKLRGRPKSKPKVEESVEAV